jgi:Mrp family chromosome partitioning ATPase
MSNSLNQAFIRAYAKERENAHSKATTTHAEAVAAKIQVEESLIQRFDTATVVVPHPHIHSSRPVREHAPVGQAETKPARNSAMMSSLAKGTPEAAPSRPTEPDPTDELRTRIASEMMRAGGFQSEQFAALNSTFSFPAAFTPNSPTATAPSKQELAPPPVTSSTTVCYPSVEAQTQAEIASSGTPAAQSTFVESTASPNTLNPEAKSEVNSVAFYKDGGIYRVDTADEATPISAYKANLAQPKDQATPAVFSNTEPHPRTNFARADAPAEAKTCPAADHSEQVAEAMQVEKKLRSAKARIFNPVWEVDQLQWPDVCMQLMDARSESLAHVAKHLIDACQEGLQILAVTSPQGGEGRTTVACCLAKLAGSRGLKTVIVDGDIENPTLCLQTNLEIEKDWQSALLNQVPLEEIAVHSIDDQITLVPLLNPVDQDELPVDDQRIANMLAELSESFDLVIVDFGHMNSPSGLLISLAEQGIVNAAIAVVDNRTSTTQRIETCIRRIRQAGVHSIGLVENFAA